MSRNLSLFTTLLLALPAAASAQERIAISFENLAPSNGTFQTPFWVGVHDGTFDIWTGGLPAGGPGSPLGDASLERLAEDGATGPIAANFLGRFPSGVETTIPGPNGPIAPGDRAFRALLVDPMAPTSRYISFASMVLPSNDAFIANGSPLAHRLFDDAGNFVFTDFIENEVLDAGTEVNDELPMNTAFFGQAAPDTGVDQGGLVLQHPGFNAPGTGGILDDFRYRNGDFTLPGYSEMMFRVRTAPGIVDDRNYGTVALGVNEVPAVATPAGARVAAFLRDGGETLRVSFAGRNLNNVVAAHLHLGAMGTNGPVVASLIGPLMPGGGDFGSDLTTVTLTGASLTGPLADYPLDALIAQMEAGNVYFNLHTNDGDPNTDGAPGDVPSGEIRGQLGRL